MSDELHSADELQAFAVQLGTRNWRVAQEAEKSLALAGPAGIDAVLWGLSHPSVQVRRGCAGFLDHHGTDACFAELRQAALYDPAPSVRRAAVHSATCQECKPCPLTGDLVGLLVEVALKETNRRVRLHALWSLHQPQDARAIAALKSILRESDPEFQLDAYKALVSQDPTYQGDGVGVHMQVALSSAHKSVRLRAIGGLRYQPQDPRAVATLEKILHTETDPRLRREAHHALKRQDPSYRAMVDAQARERGIAAARARTEKADTR